MSGAGFLSDDEYRRIYRQVPRLCVSGIIRDYKNRVLLIKRDSPPEKGLWHLPGGRVFKGETLREALARVMLRELDLTGVAFDLSRTDHIESVSEDYGNGLIIHNVDLVFTADRLSRVRSAIAAGATGAHWWRYCPSDLNRSQADFIRDTVFGATA